MIVFFNITHSFAHCGNHHHHVVPLPWISLTLSLHFSLLFIASGRSSVLYPVSSHSCCMYVWAGRPAFARTYAGVHRSTSLMRSSLFLQQCPACLVCLTWIVFVMGGRWLYSWCLVGCCRQDLLMLRAILNCGNDFKYFYLTLTIQFNLSHLFTQMMKQFYLTHR